MNNVKVKKADLLEIVRRNQQRRATIYGKAFEGYRKAMLERLQQQIVDLERGHKIRKRPELTEPYDPTFQYDRAIKMLEMSVDDVIELTSQHFGQLVLDKWDWTERFVSSNSTYVDFMEVGRDED